MRGRQFVPRIWAFVCLAWLFVLPKVEGQDLKALLESCNSVCGQTFSAYYEAEIEICDGAHTHRYLQKTSFQKSKRKRRFTKFNIEHYCDGETQYIMLYDLQNFTLIDTKTKVASQYRKEDFAIFKNEVDTYTLHPYMLTNKPFDLKDKSVEPVFKGDTLINDVFCRRIGKRYSSLYLGKPCIVEEFYTIDALSFEPCEKKVVIWDTVSGAASEVLKTYSLHFTRYDANAAFADSRFMYHKENSPYMLRYMSLSALKEQWKEQEKQQSSFAYGYNAPDFVLTDSDNRLVNTGDLRNKVVVVAFFYLNCPPCMRMLEDLQTIYSSYKDKGLEVIAVNPIDNGLTEAELGDFKRLKRLSYNVCITSRKTIEQSYLVYTYPTIFILDKKGRVVFSHQGYNALFPRKVEKAVKKHL